MNRGDIWFADLSPSVGSEINKRRPVLIVSNNANNRSASTLTVLPITSNVEKIYPFEVALSMEASGLPKLSKAQAQQIRTIARERIVGNLIGQLDEKALGLIDQAIRLHLGLA
ncbi:MAG: type II toxin-antitoxin system PemK/MazF family toxin [Betaproteobacteria bacterium]